MNTAKSQLTCLVRRPQITQKLSLFIVTADSTMKVLSVLINKLKNTINFAQIL